MRVLIAEDELVARVVLEETLSAWGYDVEVVADGTDALAALQRVHGPKLAIIDCEMPGLTGLEVCRRVRAEPIDQPPYLLLLSARDATADIVAGLKSGANDYLTKPFRDEELVARLGVAERTLELQHALSERVRELEATLAQIRILRGMLPVCAWCKKVRNDHNYWQQVEEYLSEHSNLRVTHGICPDCLDREMKDL